MGYFGKKKAADSTPQLIGLTGTFASGKDTLAKYLVEDFNYNHVSTSDLVRTIAFERYGSIERPVLRETAREERQTHGPGALVIEALRQRPQPLIVSALRSLGEAKEIKKQGGLLVFIDAAIELRYQRMKARLRDGEVKQTLEEFTAGEQKEWYGGDGDGDFNLRDIKAMSDLVLENDGGLEEFIEAAYQALHLKPTE